MDPRAVPLRLVATRSCSVLLACLVLATPGCSGCKGDSGRAAASPIHVPVEQDGAAQRVIDAALLDAKKPDFVDGDRRAWRLASLLGADVRAYAIELEDADGGRVVLAPGEGTDDREPIVMVNRMGELRVALARPADPFPPFHGRGGNRGRGGDPTRLRELRRIRILSPDAAAPTDAGELRLEILGDRAGAPKTTWTGAEFARVPGLPTAGDDTEGRQVWSLRELARTLVGPNAAVVELSGDGGKTVRIDPAAWTDPARVPVLRRTRRGLLKFEWMTPSNEAIRGDEVRGVRSLRIEGGT